MQLKNIRNQISLATCSLLQISGPVVQAAEGDWDMQTAVLYYGEGDGRVQAFEPAFYGSRQLQDDEKLSLRLVIDALTGATPNGAHASSVAQTFTTPSGSDSYTVEAGEHPLDDTFLDTRIAFGVDWEQPLDRLSTLSLGVNGSGEHDYVSLGLSATYKRDFNNRNTTLTTGIALNNDTINPEGGIPTVGAPMRMPGQVNRDGSDDSKTVTDLIVGVTQVLSKKTIMELNYSLGMTDGYQNDAYKVVTVVDPATGLPTTTGLVNVNADALPYVYESRPDSRQRNSIFYRVAHHLEQDVIHFSYRYYWDDWEITSHTLDLKYRYQMDEGSYLMPHVRYYTQDKADFYRHNLVQGTDVNASGVVQPQYFSNDYRLAKSDTVTLGLKYGFMTAKDSEFGVRAEFITQSIDDSGVPAGEETPDLNAFIVQAGYTFKW